MKKVIFISAGGTGGHIFPALSVADLLRFEYNYQIVWIGSANGIENQIIPKHSIPVEKINISGIRGKGLVRYIKLPFMLVTSIIKALGLIIKYKPCAVVGFGGYVTFSTGIAAWILRKPNIIHEQNAVAGLTNKVLSYIATKSLVAFPTNLRNQCVVGNPVRNMIANIEDPKSRYSKRSGGLNILIIGGSLGAKVFNELLPNILSNLDIDINKIVHQVGKNANKDLIYSQYDKHKFYQLEVVDFIDDMVVELSGCDLIICRAGASTVAEVATAGIAAIFVPYPYAVDNHQKHNALTLANYGAAIMVEQNEFTHDKISHIITDLNRNKCMQLAISARKFAIKDSAKNIAHMINSLID